MRNTKAGAVYHENPGQFIKGMAYDAGGNPSILGINLARTIHRVGVKQKL
ncbi:hypothetical protein [Riemerella anatipestifer]|nr:hypothetical protein [Riemerella anatipestifer]